MSKLKNEFIAAYLQLLHYYSPNEVTVKQIVEKANASRSTFYTYYESKEQLHLHMKDLLHQQFMTFYLAGEETKSGHDTTTLSLCRHILNYRAYYSYAFQDANEIQLLSNKLAELLNIVYNDKDYAIFASYGTIGYLKNWVEEGFLISPIEASEKLLKIGFTNWARDIRSEMPNLSSN